MIKPKFGEFAPLLPVEVIERASKLGSALLCDGMKGMGVPFEGCMDAGIDPVDVNMKVVGTAYTLSTDSGDNLPIHLAMKFAKEGYVLVIDGKGHQEHPYFGDLIVTQAKILGIEGIVIDGYIRDRLGMIEIGLPIFSRGYMQRGPGKQNPGEVNLPIVCGGVHVNPGDLIVGDCDGVTVVPKEHIEEALEKAEKKLAYELDRRAKLDEYARRKASGEELFSLTPKWADEMLAEIGL
ncbi:MAG: RraA family protein [Clostridia bacterium]